MSEVTTLKQLMLDAARYRWISKNIWRFDGEEGGYSPYLSPSDLDVLVDAELNRE